MHDNSMMLALMQMCIFTVIITQQPTILLLREGTEAEQGIGHIISNINACQIVVDIVKTTLGPRGMDKLIKTGRVR